MWGGGNVPPNTMTVAGLYLQLLALFILTSIHCSSSSSSSSSVIMGEGRASLPTSQLYTWIVRWKVIT